MEVNPQNPKSDALVGGGVFKDQTKRAQTAGFTTGDLTGGDRPRNQSAPGSKTDIPQRKVKWIALLALGLVIVIVLATISLVVFLATRNPLDFSLPDSEGTDWNLGSHLREGRPILIEFMSLTCGPCISYVNGTGASLKVLYANYGSQIEFVSVATTVGYQGEIPPMPELVRQFKTLYDTPWTYLVDSDGKVRDLYGVTAVPTIFIIDRDGRLAWTQVGLTSYANLEAAVRSVL